MPVTTRQAATMLATTDNMPALLRLMPAVVEADAKPPGIWL